MSTGHREDITLNENILSQCLCNQITTTYTLNLIILCQLHLNKVEIKKKKTNEIHFLKSRQICECGTSESAEKGIIVGTNNFAFSPSSS